MGDAIYEFSGLEAREMPLRDGGVKMVMVQGTTAQMDARYRAAFVAEHGRDPGEIRFREI